jgi:hypothetical protein
MVTNKHYDSELQKSKPLILQERGFGKARNFKFRVDLVEF